jgi:hypothetical protein
MHRIPPFIGATTYSSLHWMRQITVVITSLSPSLLNSAVVEIAGTTSCAQLHIEKEKVPIYSSLDSSWSFLGCYTLQESQ